MTVRAAEPSHRPKQPSGEANTLNFSGRGLPESLAQEMLATCETQKSEIAARWLGDQASPEWTPRCQVVVHRTLADYLTAAGRGAGQTRGCSTIRTHQGRIVERRIDLRADSGDVFTDALPHELTHIVLADCFIKQSPPRWADEGLALLADTPEKQAAHQRDCMAAIRQGTTLPLAHLLTRTDYPSRERWATAYAQSHSVAQFLLRRGSSTQLLEFVKLAEAKGYDSALRELYGLDGVGELERLWRQDATHETSRLASKGG